MSTDTPIVKTAVKIKLKGGNEYDIDCEQSGIELITSISSSKGVEGGINLMAFKDVDGTFVIINASELNSMILLPRSDK